jgi:hypothetical protein
LRRLRVRSCQQQQAGKNGKHSTNG